MNKIISTISILTIMISMISCREQDEGFSSENSGTPEKNSVYMRTNDSTAIYDSINAVNQPIPSDPPPKNGHQWRH